MYQSNSIKGIKSWGGMEGIDDRWRGRDLCNLYRVCWRRVNTAHLSLCVCVCVCVCLDISTLCVCVYCVCECVSIYMWICSIYYLCMELQSCVGDALLFANCFAVLHLCVCVCVCCVCCVCVCVWRREYRPPPQFCLFLALPQKRKKYILK